MKNDVQEALRKIVELTRANPDEHALSQTMRLMPIRQIALDALAAAPQSPTSEPGADRIIEGLQEAVAHAQDTFTGAKVHTRAIMNPGIDDIRRRNDAIRAGLDGEGFATPVSMTFGGCQHQWAYMNTTGCISCIKCREFRSYDDPEAVRVREQYEAATRPREAADLSTSTAPAGALAALRSAQVQLAKAADQFAFYADEHAKKKTADGDAKGATNHQWALACARVDHECRAALGDRGSER